MSLYVGLIYMSVDMLALIKLLYINHLKVFAYRSTLLVINIWFQLGAALRAPVEIIRRYIESQGKSNLNKAYKFRIYPDKKQEELLAKTFGCCRFIYNIMLDDKRKEYEATKKMKKTTPAVYKKEYPWLKEVDSLALANVQLHLEKAYKNFFVNPAVGFPKFKSDTD